MIRKFSLILLLLSASLLNGCGTLDRKTNKLSVGDDENKVLHVMRKPDRRQTNGEQEVWQYCKSGSSFGTNDHKDIMFSQGKLVTIDSYASHVTGCTNGIKQITWHSAPAQVKQVEREEFSIEKAKATCTEFGFKPKSDGMANCLLTQQTRYDAETSKQETANAEAQRMSQQEQNEAEIANQQSAAMIWQGLQTQQAENLRQQQQQRQQQMDMYKPPTTTRCHDDVYGGVACKTQ